MALGTTGALIASAAISAGTSAVGFAQAARSRNDMKQAEAEADAAIQEARKKLEVNYLAALAVKKEPYELARETLLQSAAQAQQAAVEGETRGASASSGRILMAVQEQAAQQRAAMSQEMQRLEELAAREESRLQQKRVSLDIGEAIGAQQAAADYEAAMRASQQGAIKNLASALTTGVQAFSENPFDVTKAAGTSGATPSLGGFSGTDYSTFGQDLIAFQPTIPSLTNDPFYQFLQPGVTAPKLG